MRAISLWQPWASLVACGAKPYETRSYPPPKELIGQHIAIHAAKKIDRALADFAEELTHGQHEAGGHELADRLEATMTCLPDELAGEFGDAFLPIGCVVAIARLDAAFQLGPLARGTAEPAASTTQRLSKCFVPDNFTVTYDDFGDYSEGRWAWLLSHVQPLDPPIAMKGRQGFFELPQGWLCGGDGPA